MCSFIERCVTGKALLDDIDEYVELWHESKSDLELHEFLGMTPSQYALWVADANVLPFIVTAHAENKSVDEIIERSYELPLAARSNSPDTAAKLMKWLKSEGMWE